MAPGIHTGYEDDYDGGWDRHVQSRLNAANAKIGDDGIHYFLDSGSAYDETQCNDKITDGDVLMVESEGVVGILYDVAYPVAITVASGQFGSFIDGPLPDLSRYKSQLGAAIAMAQQKGFDLDPRIAALV